jgi:F-type H+-transporting ATPase subunit epsilon
MTRAFTLNIVTPSKVIYEGQSRSLVAPSELGYLGVLVDHAPLVTNVVSGVITTHDLSGALIQWDYRGAGFLEVLANTVTLLLDQVPVRRGE